MSNVPLPVELIIKYFADKFKMKLISQLIKDTARVLQKLLKCFNGSDISTFFLLQSASVFPVIFTLDLNDSEFFKVAFDSYL